MQWLVSVQAILAHLLGFFFLSDAKKRVPEGTPVAAFSKHGGIWGDVLYVSALIAWIVAKYAPDWSVGTVMFGALLGAVSALTALSAWSRSGTEEAFVLGGKTTVVGYIHGFYTWIALSVLFSFLYGCGHMVPQQEALGIAVVFVLHSALGSFQPSWIARKKIDKGAWLQFAVATALVGLLYFRIVQ